MNYTNDIIARAYDELDRRRETARAAHSARVEDIRITRPEIYEIYSEIASTKDRLAEVILSKNGDVRANIEAIRDRNLKQQENLKRLLERFSLPQDYLNIHYSCPLCMDTGVHLGNRCSCVTALLDKYAVEKLNEQCKIKLHRFADFDLSYYPETCIYRGTEVNSRERMSENLRFCMDYVENFSAQSHGLFFSGGTGLGKTLLSSCIAGELLQRGFSVAFDSIQNYLRDIENEHFGRSEGNTLQILLNADLTILDDLGIEFSSQFNLSSIYNIINSRLNMGKPTIVSSNLSLNELLEKYGERIYSRLTGTFFAMKFFGKDVRQIRSRMGIFA